MCSTDGGPSAVDDRDREGKSPRQCLTAEVDEIDSKAIVWDLRDGSSMVMVNYCNSVRQETADPMRTVSRPPPLVEAQRPASKSDDKTLWYSAS